MRKSLLVFPAILSLALISFSSEAVTPLSAPFQKEHQIAQLIVKFRSGFAGTEENKILQQIGAKIISRFESSASILINAPRYNNPKSLEQLAIWLQKLPFVEFVEPNFVWHAFNNLPNDPMFEQQWGLKNTGAKKGVAGADIDANLAWERTTGSKEVVVAVIDTGIDYNHPDLAPNIWNNPGETGIDSQGRDKRTNGVDDDGNGYIDDWRGWDFANNDNDPFDDNKHGTHCAGTIGAKGNNGNGVSGVAWDVSLVGLKFLKKDGSGDTASAIKAIEYATSMGFPILSNSWGGPSRSDALAAAIEKANAKKILVIAAAGNNYSDNDLSPQFPASYPSSNIVAVAATDNADRIAAFSNFGKNSVHLGAPGTDILSTVPNEKYDAMDGTSMAAPHVAGAAALIKSMYPEMGALEIKNRLLQSAEVIPALANKTVSGGRLNAASALEDDTTPPSEPIALQEETTGAISVVFSWIPSGDDNTQGKASRYEVRLSGEPILTEEGWNKAKPMRFEWLPEKSDGRLMARIDDLPLQTKAFLTMRAFDNVGLQSPLSKSLSFATKNVIQTYQNSANSMDGITSTGIWGVDTEDGRSVFSASPGKRYPENLKETLQFPPFNLSEHSFLELKTKYDTERNFDFGIIEVSWDNGLTWTEVKRITGGVYQFQTLRIDLAGIIPTNATQFLMRFKFTSDHSVSGAGWFVDEVTFYRTE